MSYSNNIEVLKREHSLALNEVIELQRQYAMAVDEVQDLTNKYNLLTKNNDSYNDNDNDTFTLVVKRNRRKKKPNDKKYKTENKNLVKKSTRARKIKIMENDPFKPKPSLFGFHPWGDYESE